MSRITDTYGTLVANLAKKYPRLAPAAVLFWYDEADSRRGLRLESVELMMEFVSNVKFGRDPEGVLFFHDIQDFDDDMDSNYRVYYNTEKEKAIQIDFYPGSSHSEPFATFLARDEQGIQLKVLGDGVGKWRSLKTGTACAEIHKVTRDDTVEIKLRPIGKKVTFPASKKIPIKGKGVMYFPSIAGLTSNNCVVNYNNDRILFYDSTVKEKYIAVFFPAVGTTVDMDSETLLAPPSATWENL